MLLSIGKSGQNPRNEHEMTENRTLDDPYEALERACGLEPLVTLERVPGDSIGNYRRIQEPMELAALLAKDSELASKWERATDWRSVASADAMAELRLEIIRELLLSIDTYPNDPSNSNDNSVYSDSSDIPF